MTTRRRCAIAVAVAACGAACGGRAVPAAGDDDADRPERWYRLSWRGAPVGWAVETERPGRIERRERIEVRRGDTTSVTELEIVVEIAADLTPTALRVRGVDAGRRWATTAVREADGWHRDGAAAILAPAEAVPGELVPILVRAQGQFAGPVILTGWDLAVGPGVVVPAGTRRLAARTVIAGRAIDAAIELDIDGNATSIVDSSGTVAIRVDAATATAAWQPIDVIAAGALALADVDVPIELSLAAGATPVPPAIPGQRVVADGDRWSITLDPELPGALAAGPTSRSYAAEIAPLIAAVHDAITPSLDSHTAGAGDCTAYAVAFAAYARMADIPVQVVTGYVVDGERLVRHRWNLAWTGARWISVDASQPDAPAPRLGVALGDETAASLAASAMFDLR